MRRGPPLFLLDYDGTLAPIAQRPEEALPHPEVPPVLEALRARYPVYVVTGRRVRDLEALLPLPGLPVVGGHGAEEGLIGGETRTVLAPDLFPLRSQLPPCPEVWVEDKGFALALHYRQAPNPQAVEACLSGWLARVEGLLEALNLEALPGKRVLEIKPKGLDKGKAVLRLLERHPGHYPVYIGDDVTDEAAFQALKGRGFTLKVGPGPTMAEGRIPDVEGVVAYLKTYL